MITAHDKPYGDGHAHRAREDVGDVANGVAGARAQNATFWVDAHWRGGWVEGRAEEEDSRCGVLELCGWGVLWEMEEYEEIERTSR